MAFPLKTPLNYGDPIPWPADQDPSTPTGAAQWLATSVKLDQDRFDWEKAQYAAANAPTPAPDPVPAPTPVPAPLPAGAPLHALVLALDNWLKLYPGA